MPDRNPQAEAAPAASLTFVRPLPRHAHVPDVDDDATATRIRTFSFSDRLFPPRDLEESGMIPPVKGIQLANFTIEERIGRGGMGAVFKARDLRLDRTVALKVLAPDFSNDPEAVARFRTEARAAARLDHNNIARVHSSGEDHGLYFIAFEFVVGTTVKERIEQEGRLSQAFSLNCAIQVTSALAHTSAANVVHRDIKPSNILVMTDGRVKLVDLGLARELYRDVPSELTVAGTALGTFDYISPEQAADARLADVRSDIYSLGCTLFHMLTGVPPYPQGTPMQKMMQHAGPAPPEAIFKNPELNPRFSRVISTMMAADPDMRYENPAELMQDLMLLAGELGLEPQTPETLVWVGGDPPRWPRVLESLRTWFVVGGLLVLLVLADRYQVSSRVPPAVHLGGDERVEEVEANRPSQLGAVDPAPDALSPSPPPRSAVLPPAPAENPPVENRSGGGSVNREQAAARPNSAPETPPRIVTPAGNAPEEPNPIAQGGFVVTGPGRASPETFQTLAQACAAAPTNSTIEIHSSGVLVVGEGLPVVNKNLRIRAAAGQRPVLRFDLSSLSTMGALTRPATMVRVENGTLELYDLDLEMVVTSELKTDWAFVALHEGASLGAHGVLFTVTNPDQSPAGMVLLPDDSSNSLTRLERRARSQSTVSLSECFCRGEADFILQRSRRDLRLRCDHVAFGLSGSVVQVNPPPRSDGPPGELPALTATLDHVTVYAAGGLLNSFSGAAGVTPQMELDISDSLFRMDNPQVPFLSLVGHESFEVMRTRLRLRESRDPSYYQLAGPMCVVESSSSLLGGMLELQLEDLGPEVSQIVSASLIELPEEVDLDRLHALTRQDLMLRPADDNPAWDAAGDLLYPGVNWNLTQLPRVEAER